MWRFRSLLYMVVLIALAICAPVESTLSPVVRNVAEGHHLTTGIGTRDSGKHYESKCKD